MFNSEIFFNLILPPIIFHAGYSMKRVRCPSDSLSRSMTDWGFRKTSFAISERFWCSRWSAQRSPVCPQGQCSKDPRSEIPLLCSVLVYGSARVFSGLRGNFSFTDSLYFGAIISATDPGGTTSFSLSSTLFLLVTVLSIFNDLNVDVDLYAIIFGESVLNDAVCLVLAE